MGRIESESRRLFCPDITDIFVGREAFERLQAPSEVVGGDKIVEMSTQLIVAVVVVALDGRILDGAVHSLDLPIGPRMIGFGKPMLDAVVPAGAIEGMAAQQRGRSLTVLRQIGELDAIVGEHRVDRIGNTVDQGLEERAGGLGVRPIDELRKDELRGAVDRHEEVELAFLGAHLGDVDVEVADRVGLELLLLRLIARHLRQTANAMALEAAMQG